MAKDPGAALRPLKHGGAAARRSLSLGTEFTGLAAAAEQAVYDELETQGRPAVVRRNAARLQATADIYYGALLGAAAKGDLAKVNSYIKTFGWLTAAALRAWAQDEQEQKQRFSDDITTVLRGDDGDD